MFASAAAIVLLWTAHAAAKMVIAESLEWLADSSHHIAVGEISRTMDRWQRGAVWEQSDYPLHVIRTTRRLKGTPPEEIIFSWRLECAHWHWPPPDKAKMILFLDGNKKVFHVIQLSVEPCETPRSADFRTVEKPEEILGLLERRVELKRGSSPPLPPGRPIFGEPHPRPRRFLILERPEEVGAYYLIVPADPERKAEILEATRAADSLVRATAARQLAAYPDDETIRVLKKLLMDPGESRLLQSTNGPWSFTWESAGGSQPSARDNEAGSETQITLYPVRQAAYETLLELNVNVPKPEGYVDGVPPFDLN